MTVNAQTLADLPTLAAKRFGDKLALANGKTRLSFIEVNERVTRRALELRQLDLGPGDHVILHLPNGWEWVVTYYAICRIGAVVVPANILLVPEEVGYIARDCGAGAIVAPPERRAAILGSAGTEGIKHYVSSSAAGGELGSATPQLDPCLERSIIFDDIEPDSIAMISYT